MHPDFETILNWRLLAGSHPFPGPDGGTCINEAAIVAAGLPYRAIRSSADCPPCFSRPVAAYALGLNDTMPDEARPQLMAFVLRLSGSADAPEIEAARTRTLALESVRRILAPLCAVAGMVEDAKACIGAPDWPAALAAANAAAWRGGARSQAAAEARRWREGALTAAVSRTATAAQRAGTDARCAAEVAEGAAPFVAGTWSQACAILDEALAIGRQAPEIALVGARQRMDAARTGALA
ncbi:MULTISPECIES: hypothetical protein [Methylobacterium]|jgi:hypothetical protein|uniref:Uncharacterized protein n=2 Tax=Methylobacterium TaxID=407 RepID=A0AAE8L7E5_9HYPH|nr:MULTISPECIES: hypothetical protein [Methylobacterium]KOX60329.1 hypothetical protein ADL19_01630 [Streptomyces purpurogeneiscleroticus]AIQ90417.1 protein of unassigned function [Methylobacterium oryzae CBMB20]APT31145.1 hypothetical protein MCBMB27_01854 [Methylobacterium phyllosphaerae]AWV17423.1 hypothetical protein A3862_19575 [Methylobacterium sp. XJLW]MBP33105.1 hypothetical protein [Methylobacterium sp.]